MTALKFDQIEVLQRDFLQQESLDEFSTTKRFLPATVENRPGLSKLLVVGWLIEILIRKNPWHVGICQALSQCPYFANQLST